jgi:hypothetical protein
MSRTFLYGGITEKARVAQVLMADILAGLPDDLLTSYQDALSAGAKALQDIQHDLRSKDRDGQ